MEDSKIESVGSSQPQPEGSGALPAGLIVNSSRRPKKILVLVVGVLVVLVACTFYLKFYRSVGRINVTPSDVTLTPSSEDSLGVDPGSSFVLSSRISLNPASIKSSLTVKPALAFEVSEVKNKEYKISFAKPLSEGKVYVFSLATSGTSSGQASESASAPKDLSWAFQIKNPFRILQTLPKNKATAVPVNSGVEIYLSHEGYKSI